jgi:hypothetical protein
LRPRLLPNRTFLLITALFAGIGLRAKEAPTAAKMQLSNTLFIENKGQLTDQFGHSRKDIDYSVNAADNFKMFVGKGKIQYQWARIENAPKPGEKPSPNLTTSYYIMNVTLEGANPHAQMIADDEQAYYERYYTAHANGISAHSFKKITYRNVYKNIDWVLYSSNNSTGVKYDFIVHPGGNPKDIKIKYDGATSLRIENGALVAATPMGTLTEAAPVSYTESRENVNSNYKLTNNTLSFETGEYKGKLIIDPVLKWGTYYGGDSYTLGNNVTSDTFGSVFLCGATQSLTAIATTTGMYQTTYGGGNYDSYLVKFNPDGTRGWATYYGAAGSDFANAIACDKLGNVIIAGHTSSGSGITTSGAQQPLNASQFLITVYDYDAFVAKFAPNGGIIWGTFMGGLYSEECYAVSTDQQNNVYIGGLTLSSNNIATSGAFLTTPAAGYLVKYNASGARQWGTYIRGTVYNIATDISDNVFIVGSTTDTTASTGGIASLGAHQSTIGGGANDGFFMKFNGSGSKLLGSYYGGYNADDVKAIAVDPSGDFYIGGRTLSPTSIATSTGAQPNYSGAFPPLVYDGFIIKFNQSGIRQWGTYIGDSLGHDNIASMSISAENSLWVFGTTGSRTLIATPGAHQTTNAGPPPNPIPIPLQYTECDGYVMRLTPSGVKKWATYYGGSSWEFDVKGLIVRNKIYLAGSTLSTSSIAYNGHQNTFTGTTNDPRAFLVQFEADTNVSIATPFVDTNLCAGDSLYVKYLTMTDFGRTPLGFPLNTFTIQLSDSAGNFTAPVNIGSINSFHSDFVPCKIPVTTYEAKKYRIRIIASNPRDTFYHIGPNIRIWQYHKPLAGIYATRDTICENTAILLDDFNSSTWPYTYTWQGPNGFNSTFHNAIVPATLVNYTYTGDYIVEANNNGCKMKDTVHVTIGMSPNAPKILGDTSICLGDTIMLTAFCDTPGVSFVWQDPTLASPSQSSSLTIPNVTMTDDGEYRLTAISILGCPSPTIKRRINIRPLPNPDITNVDPLCSGDTLKLNVNDTAFVTNAWGGPGGYTSTLKSPIIINTNTGQSGKYYVINTNKYGCTAADTVDVLVKPLPNQVDAINNSPICSTKDLQLNANNPTTGATYAWSGPNGFTSNSQNPVITGAATAASGVYKVIVDLNGCKKEDTTRVTVYLTPDKPVITGNTPLYVGEILRLKVENPQTGADYLWLGPNNFSAPTLTPSVNSVLKSMAGYYKVTATIGTCSSSDSILVQILEKPEQAGKVLFAFPNPNKGTFTIVASVSSDKDVEIGIFDSGGKLVHSEKATPKNKKLEHTVYTWGKLASGVYRVNVLIDGKVETISLTVQL